METALSKFHKRQHAIRRKHRRMAQGYRNRMDRSGIIIQVPDNKASGYALKVMVWLVALFFAFKTMLLIGLGPEQYTSRVSALSIGNAYEQLGAAAMQVDPVTAMLADLVAPLFT